MARYVKFYIGIWVPLATCWLLVVVVAAWHYRSGLGVGLLAATFGSLLAVLFAAFTGREDKKGSLGFIRAHPELSERDLLRCGLKKGALLGVASILGVAFLLGAPIVVDRILTAFGK